MAEAAFDAIDHEHDILTTQGELEQFQQENQRMLDEYVARLESERGDGSHLPRQNNQLLSGVAACRTV